MTLPPRVATPLPLSRRLAAAPHRLLFLLGACQLLAGLLWWGFALEARLDGLPGPDAIPGAAAHGWLMFYGLFPFYIFGFLFTALPNWVEHGRVPPATYLTSAGLLGLGVLLFYPGLSIPGLAGLAALIHALGFGLGLQGLWQLLRGSRQPDLRQPWLAWSACLAGLIGELVFAWGALIDQAEGLRIGLIIAAWGFLAPLFLAVCHRMVPFFTSRVVKNYVMVRPYAPLGWMVAACLGHGFLESLALYRWTWLVDLPLAGITVWFISRWGIARALPERLLAMLHIAFVWAAIAFALHGLDSLLAGRLGLAPLHALGIGFFASMLLAMASRVSLGHSGRPLKADRLTWMLFWGVQGAAVLRMAPDLFPDWIPVRAMSLSGLVWLLAFGLWVVRYAPLSWRARADGKPG
ncbi:MAG: NnrS family protein [Pseudomonadota bacterium]